MSFNYPDMTSTSYNNMRIYETADGKYYPSITTVLGNTVPEEKAVSLKRWQDSLGADVAKQKTKEAADHGTAVHLLAERYLKKEELIQPGDNISQQNIAAFNALKLKLNKVEEVWGQEIALYSDIIGVAGRTDLIGVYKGKPSIIDFKTSSRLKGQKQIDDYRLQLTAYAIMHNEMFGTNIVDGVILMTSDGGFPQEFFVDLSQYVEPLMLRVDEFYAKLNAKL
jgi:ATP-dependent exoDNAse (exonuclease V) beta subunit